MTTNDPERAAVEDERRELLYRLERWLETPMIVLGFAWLGLLVLELVGGTRAWIETTTIAIWVVFVVDFVLRLVLAPDRTAYLRRNWLTIPALFLPALRILRIAQVVRVMRVARAVRGARLLSVISSLNRGTRALGRTMQRRGVGYALALTVLVLMGGSAGMYAFESGGPADHVFGSYGSTLWWTAMTLTTMGADVFPRTGEGRLLCVLLALYGFIVFGYVTATLASHFLARDAEDETGDLASAHSIAALADEIRALRLEVRSAREPGTG